MSELTIARVVPEIEVDVPEQAEIERLRAEVERLRAIVSQQLSDLKEIHIQLGVVIGTCPSEWLGGPEIQRVDSTRPMQSRFALPLTQKPRERREVACERRADNRQSCARDRG